MKHFSREHPPIQKDKEVKNFKNLDFYITAGPYNRDWSIRGGRYKFDGTRVGGNFRQPNVEIDLSKYEHIIFIGQYIQVDRFCDFEKSNYFQNH